MPKQFQQENFSKGKLMKKCEYCGSIWVCWNWFHQTKENLNSLNPHKHFENDEWGHECWKCDSVQITSYKVKNGIPYKILYYCYEYFKGIIK